MGLITVLSQLEDLKNKANVSIGYNGTDIYNDSDVHYGNWKALVVLIEATINTIVEDGGNSTNVSTIPTATAFPAGTFISAKGVFTSIDLTSGTVAMYRS